MAPCDEYEEMISLLASVSLDAAEAARVREHLAACPACREYHERMQTLCDGVRALALEVPVRELPPGFDRRVALAIRKQRRRRIALRMILAAAACVAVAVMGWQLEWGGHPREIGGEEVVHSTPPAAAAPAAADDSLPTYDAYRRAASASTQSLNALLDRHAARYLLPVKQQPAATAGFIFGGP